MWGSYLNDLKKAHINLSGNPDEWVFYIMNKARGDYSTKIGYAGLQGPHPTDVKWWWGELWKVKAPLKGILCMLL